MEGDNDAFFLKYRLLFQQKNPGIAPGALFAVGRVD